MLRWGHLAAENPRAECVLVGGFGDFIEKQFETIRDLAARGLSVWCLDWRGQGGSTRPKRWPHRPRARRFERDAAELAAFAAAKLQSGLPRVLIAHSMGGAIALLCLHSHPRAVPGGDPVGADARPVERSDAADPAARVDRPGAADPARPLPAARHLSLAAEQPADAGAQPHLERRRALPHPPCLGIERAGACGSTSRPMVGSTRRWR